MTALSINLNKIALIRNSREGNYPNVVDHARLCIDQGVEGITVHGPTNAIFVPVMSVSSPS